MSSLNIDEIRVADYKKDVNNPTKTNDCVDKSSRITSGISKY